MIKLTFRDICLLGLLFVIVSLYSCNKSTDRVNRNSVDTNSNQPRNIAGIDKTFTLDDFFKTDTVLSKKVDSVFNLLSVQERIGQMIVPSAGELGSPTAEITKLIKEKKLGGVVLVKGTKNSFGELINLFKKTASESGGLPLIFSCDAEPSLINSKISGIPEIIHSNKILTAGKSSETAQQITELIKNMGFQQNFAPVCDLAMNTEIIGDRSFGNDVNKVSMLAAAFIKETQSLNIAATAKHFPGHGNVQGDSHKGLVYIDGDIAEYDIFKRVIDSGVISVMVGHIAIKNNKDYSTDGLPSSISRKIVTNLLKEKMNFKGIVITDGMNMGALNKFQYPSLSAIEAGCDMVLMPADITKLINSASEEIKANKDFEKQVYDSVKKIIRLKICLGLM